jgi:hypothetical protein
MAHAWWRDVDYELFYRLTRERDEARAEVARLREALALSEVDVALARTWCRLCRTENRSDARSRADHPHAMECILYRATPLVTEGDK